MTANPFPYEAGILQVISEGMPLDTILEQGPWTVNDVSQVLRKYQFVVFEDGSVGRAEVERFDHVLALAMASPVQHVKTKALRAQAMLRDLKRWVQVAEAERATEAARERARHAVMEWQKWLGEAQVEARDELKRLNRRGQQRRAAG